MRRSRSLALLRIGALLVLLLNLPVLFKPAFAQRGTRATTDVSSSISQEIQRKPQGRLIWLGTLGGFSSKAWDVSADGPDGPVVVGSSWDANGDLKAFRWTVSGGMQDLGALPPDFPWSVAYGVSWDGSVVVGRASTSQYDYLHAFRWTASGGMEDLNTTYAPLLTHGSVLFEATAISPDGRYIVGMGWNGAMGRLEAFLLDTHSRSQSRGLHQPVLGQ